MQFYMGYGSCVSANLLKLVDKYALLFADFLRVIKQLTVLHGNPRKMFRAIDGWSERWFINPDM